MPLYPYRCASCGHAFELVRPHTEEVGHAACEKCGKPAPQDYQAKMVEAGAVDGPTEAAIYDPAWPKMPSGKYLVPSKKAYREHIARSEGRLEAIG